MEMQLRDFDQLPLYGCLTGFTLPVENFEIGPGLLLRKTFVDTFGGWSMGFVAPGAPETPHPAPWAPVNGKSSSMLQARVELAITQTSLEGFSLPTATAWLVASLLRLQIQYAGTHRRARKYSVRIDGRELAKGRGDGVRDGNEAMGCFPC
jgi:hypothetical protein